MSNEALENICLKCEGLCRMTHKGGCAFRNIDNSRCADYEELEEYMKQVEPNFNSHIEKGTIEMNNEFYNLVQEKMARLINENQKYKEVFDESYIRVTHLLDYYSHYKALPNSIIDELINLQLDLNRLKEVE